VINLSESKPVVMLLDMNNLLWRAAGATSMTNLSNSKGKVTGHIYNLTKMFLNYWDRADQIILVEDRKCLRRYEIYPEYKGNRKQKNEDSKVVFDMVQELRQLVEHIPCAHAYSDGEEADDVIATLAPKFAELGNEVVIVSSDKDLWQIINQDIKVVTGSDKMVKSEMFEEKFNISGDLSSTHFVLSKALLGDPSDNIPKVGLRMMSKDLKRLLSMCDGTIDDLLRVCKTDESGTAKKIIDGEETLRRNYRLCLLRKDAKVTFVLNEGNVNAMEEVLTEAECNSIIGLINKFRYPPKNYDNMKEATI